MNEHLSSASLKSLAKGQLLGKYGTVVAAYAIHMGCILFTSFMISMFIDTATLIGNIIYLLVSILLSLFGGLFVYGEAYIYLKIACINTKGREGKLCHFNIGLGLQRAGYRNCAGSVN